MSHRRQPRGQATIGDVLGYASFPVIAGWLAPWLPKDVLAPLAFRGWQNDARNIAVVLSTVLVVCAVGYCWRMRPFAVRRLAVRSTLGFGTGVVACGVLRFVVGEVLDGEGHVTVVRDYIWQCTYVLMLVAMVLTVVFWACYMRAQR